ncbi:hypothetical protein PoB_006383800 [Plakobranchus ocellatus]|uniref:Uncharacterized protein n=1 Tax=Plakobranchus ocellatus TaxID=259542 RepID=A0AAV4CZG9_9GAST|nr:hypothetical protein PoB_006383800 [Plakobranchus ocellatus]
MDQSVIHKLLVTHEEFFLNSAPGFPAHHGAQPRGHIARLSSAVSGLPWSYTPNRGCGTSTGIDPSLIRRKMTCRLGSVESALPSRFRRRKWPRRYVDE